jgi:two-component system alkaline phosphatase synthesis response regulator PhoP
LIDLVYDVAYAGYDRAIDSHVKNLRRKIEPDSGQPRYVLTVYGVGYKLSDELVQTSQLPAGSEGGNEA